MTKPNPTAAAMALAFVVMEDTNVPKRLRDRAKDLFAEHAPEVLDPGFDFMRALLNTAEKRKLSSIKSSAVAISDIFTASVKAEEAGEQKTNSILPTTPVANTRYHEHDGKLYLIRDTVYGARIQCQYAVKSARGAVEWKDCRQGVNFAEIEPFIA